MKDLYIVLRSVRERTEEACLQIVRSQLGPEGPLYVVRDRPFAEAHTESMRLAVGAGARWSLFLDADVLLRRDALADMLREAEAISQPFYMLNFRVLDRGFGGPAYGVHLYATEHLRTALKFADLAREAQRPEARLCQAMAQEARIPSLASAQVVGLHGYEQFYTDLYRTAFVRAVKFAPCRDSLLRRYRSRYETDADDRVMFWGLVDGMVYGADHETAPLDKEFYREQASRVLVMLGLEEKGPFTLSQDEVERVFQGHALDEGYLAIRRYVCPSGFILAAPPDRSLRKRVRRALFSFGRRMKRAALVALRG